MRRLASSSKLPIIATPFACSTHTHSNSLIGTIWVYLVAEAEVSEAQTLYMATKFVALGGVWLDEICASGKPPLVDVPGGSVAFGQYRSGRTSEGRHY